LKQVLTVETNLFSSAQMFVIMWSLCGRESEHTREKNNIQLSDLMTI